MFVQCRFKNVKDQLPVKNYALYKIGSKIEHLTDNPIGLYLVIKQDKLKVLVDCRLIMKDSSTSIILKEISGSNFFEAIDNLAGKIDRAIRKRKTQKSHNIKKLTKFSRLPYTDDGLKYSDTEQSTLASNDTTSEMDDEDFFSDMDEFSVTPEWIS